MSEKDTRIMDEMEVTKKQDLQLFDYKKQVNYTIKIGLDIKLLSGKNFNCFFTNGSGDRKCDEIKTAREFV